MPSFLGARKTRCASHRAPSNGAVSLSLPVLPTPDAQRPTPLSPPHDAIHIRKSRSGPWRAAVLIAVHLLFAIHLGLWFLSGMRDGVRETLSPVEPSESMYSLEAGLVNAGFIFFILALTSTLLFGRFFCGWGCHVVALQDFCGWLMKKCGVHPKPFRSRLLVFVPLIVALYMFVWPTFKRLVLFQLLAGGDADAWQANWGVLLGESAKFPGWSDHLIIEDFWKTFAPWYIAIPFLIVCGFGTVYFLGAKGFCTYACPYGGFFGPLDLVSFGHIKVTDACEGCGHCTATCTSNVRVHEEVRDFGMVVDPGCMKCMDCVSVCPNHALHFGFGKPSLFTKPRPEAQLRRQQRKGNYDLSWAQEIILAVVFLLLVLGFRSMLNDVPLLMALGMAGIGTFFAWKLMQMAREPNSRIHGFQLKLKGRLRPVGLVFIPLAVLCLAAGAWGAIVKNSKFRGEALASTLTVPADAVLRQGLVPDAKSRQVAERALRRFEQAGPISAGGWGWTHRPDELQTIAYLQLVLGKFQDTERTLMDIMSRGHPLDPIVLQLGDILHAQGVPDETIVARYEQILRQQPHLAVVRHRVAEYYLQASRPADALRLYEDPLATRPGDAVLRKDFGGFLIRSLGQPERALQLLAEATEIARGERTGMRVRRDPETLRQIAQIYYNAPLGRADLALPLLEYCATFNQPLRPTDILYDLANAQYLTGKHMDAVATMKRAVDENPDNPNLPKSVAQMYDALGNPAEAQAWAKRTQEVQRRIEEDARKRQEKLRKLHAGQ